MFKVGDLAVYPAHGVGVVEKIEQKEISGTQVSFYVLRLLDNDMTIMIPLASASSNGMREVISSKEIPKVLKILKEKKKVSAKGTWNKRQKEYMEKIRTGSVFEIAEVLRELYLLKLDKELSFGERKVLETARNLLIKELSVAKKTKSEDIEKEIEKIFHA